MPRSRPFVPADPKTVARAKALYEGGHTRVEDIAALLGMSQTTFCQRVRLWGWARRRRRRALPNRPKGAGRGPVVAWSPQADPAAWLGADWTRDGKVSERERRFVENLAANRAALSERETRAVERSMRAIRAIVRARREYMALVDEDAAREARASRRDDRTAAEDEAVAEELRRRLANLNEQPSAREEGREER